MGRQKKSWHRFGAEEQLILLSAATADRRQATQRRAERLCALVDWILVAELLRVEKLLPTLGPRLIELTGDHIPDEFVAIAARALDAGRQRGVFLQLISERVRRALADAGIRSAVLKGPLLSEALYGDPGRRLSSDIDLLVAYEQLGDAVEVVRELGYVMPTDHVEDSGLPLLHFALGHERDELPPVELHWRIHCYERSFARERLLPASDDFNLAWRPAPIDELTALLLFYARDGFLGLRLAIDIGAWWDIFGMGLQPGALDTLIHAYPALNRVLPVAIGVANKIVGLPAGQLTIREPKLGIRGRIATRLANPSPHSSQIQLYAEMGLIEGLLAPPGGLRGFIKRQVLPPREVLQEYARKGRRGRTISRWGYGMRMLVRYALAMAGLAHISTDTSVVTDPLRDFVRGPQWLWRHRPCSSGDR